MTIKKYISKHVVKEAVQFTGENFDEIMAFMSSDEFSQDLLSPEIVIRTLEGNMIASPGDYIIKGLKGEFYACKPDIFENSYEAVNE